MNINLCLREKRRPYLYFLAISLLAGFIILLYTSYTIKPKDTYFYIGCKVYYDNYLSVYDTASPKRIESNHFIIEYYTEGRSACSDDYAEKVLRYFEIAWHKYFIDYGFNLPESREGDKILIKVEKLYPSYGATHVTTDGSGKWYVNYIAIDNSLNDEKIMETAAHELFHCIQAAYDSYEGDTENYWIIEGMAVGAEDAIFPDNNLYIRYINRWMNTPDKSLVTRSYDAAILWRYFWEFHGVEKIKTILKMLSIEDGINALIKAFGGYEKFRSVYAEFIKTTYFKDVYSDGKLFAKPYISKTIDLSLTDNANISDLVKYYGIDYYRILLNNNSVYICFNGSSSSDFLLVLLYPVNKHIVIELKNYSFGTYLFKNPGNISEIALAVTRTSEDGSGYYELSITTLERVYRIKMIPELKKIVANPGDKITIDLILVNDGEVAQEFSLNFSSKLCDIKLINNNGQLIGSDESIILNPGESKSLKIQIFTPTTPGIRETIGIDAYSKGFLVGSTEIAIVTTGLKVRAYPHPGLASIMNVTHVYVQLLYYHNHTPIAHGMVIEEITGLIAYTNESGWAIFNLTENKVGKVVYKFYGISDKNHVINYSINVEYITIDWTYLKVDKVLCDRYVVNVSQPVMIQVRVVYAHNGKPVSGGIVKVPELGIISSINSSGWATIIATSNVPRTYIIVKPLRDLLGYVTYGEKIRVNVSWTGIVLHVNVLPSHIVNVGDYVKVEVSAVWAHNMSLAGKCKLYLINGSNIEEVETDERGVYSIRLKKDVTSVLNITFKIADQKYRLLGNTSASVTIIWTGIIVEYINVSRKIVNVGTPVDIYVKIKYAHNSEPCGKAEIVLNTGAKGYTDENGIACIRVSKAVAKTYTINVSHVLSPDGITHIMANQQAEITWTYLLVDKAIIFPNVTVLHSPVNVRLRIVYAHNSSPARGVTLSIYGFNISTDGDGWINTTLHFDKVDVYTIKLEVIEAPSNIQRIVYPLLRVVVCSEVTYNLWSQMNNIKANGCNVSQFMRAWNKIIELMDKGKVDEAENISRQLYNEIERAERSMALLNKAKNVISKAKGSGILLFIWEAEMKLHEAINAFKRGDYNEAAELASESIKRAYKAAAWSTAFMAVFLAAAILLVTSELIKHYSEPEW
ncbi:MAG TPA: hypothetical protein ENF53_00170 [Thermoprotei archaeon]|nr:hypothetical protein [Thermoprotei archaeon]